MNNKKAKEIRKKTKEISKDIYDDREEYDAIPTKEFKINIGKDKEGNDIIRSVYRYKIVCKGNRSLYKKAKEAYSIVKKIGDK